MATHQTCTKKIARLLQAALKTRVSVSCRVPISTSLIRPDCRKIFLDLLSTYKAIKGISDRICLARVLRWVKIPGNVACKATWQGPLPDGLDREET